MGKAAGFGQKTNLRLKHSSFTSWWRAAAPSAFDLSRSGENRDGMWEELPICHLCQNVTSGSRKAGSCPELCIVSDEEGLGEAGSPLLEDKVNTGFQISGEALCVEMPTGCWHVGHDSLRH